MNGSFEKKVSLLDILYEFHDNFICNFVVIDLEEKLKSSDARLKLIVTDGVFSMDGNVAPLPQICDLADKYGALVFMDECHATGFFGKTGRYV